MAIVATTITDRTGGVTVVAESDAPIPIDDDNNPIVDQFTGAQVASVLAAVTLDDSSGSSERRTLVHQGSS